MSDCAKHESFLQSLNSSSGFVTYFSQYIETAKEKAEEAGDDEVQEKLDANKDNCKKLCRAVLILLTRLSTAVAAKLRESTPDFRSAIPMGAGDTMDEAAVPAHGLSHDSCAWEFPFIGRRKGTRKK